jgi:tetratricopeptide (TPR) repeat protein
VSDRLVTALEAVPAWQYGAAHALQEHRASLIDAPRLHPEVRDRLLLRFGELLSAAGAPGEGWAAVNGSDPSKLDPDQRRRRDFLRRRTWVLAQGQGLPDVEWEPDGSALDAMRDAVLRAEGSQNHGSHPEAVPIWREALMESARGQAAEELEFEASQRLGMLLVLQGRGAEAITHLKRAQALARRYNAIYDEAALSSHLYAASLMTRDIDAAIATANRAKELPEDIPGALPRGVVDMVKATELARRGDKQGMLEALDAAQVAALERSDGMAYVTIISAKARLYEAGSQRYGAYRVLQIGRTLLRRNGHSKEVQLVDVLLSQLRKKVSPEEWEGFATRLKADLTES